MGEYVGLLQPVWHLLPSYGYHIDRLYGRWLTALVLNSWYNFFLMLFRFILAWSCLISTWYHLGQLTVLYYYYLVPCLDTLGTVWYVSAAWGHLGHLVSLDWFFIKWLVKPALTHWMASVAWENLKHFQVASNSSISFQSKVGFSWCRRNTIHWTMIYNAVHLFGKVFCLLIFAEIHNAK